MAEPSQGARRATGDGSAIAPAAPDPEVVAVAKRRQYSSKQKQRILTAADRCTEPGQIGALLRREGIYSSQLARWRKQRSEAQQAALAPQQRGRKADPVRAEARRVAELTRDNERLHRQLAQAHAIIDAQKKLCDLLGLPTAGAREETAA